MASWFRLKQQIAANCFTQTLKWNYVIETILKLVASIESILKLVVSLGCVIE